MSEEKEKKIEEERRIVPSEELERVKSMLEQLDKRVSEIEKTLHTLARTPSTLKPPDLRDAREAYYAGDL